LLTVQAQNPAGPITGFPKVSKIFFLQEAGTNRFAAASRFMAARGMSE